MKRLARFVDIPPVWLVAACALGGWLAEEGPGPRLGGWAAPAGVALMAAGVAVILAAIIELRRHRTTVIPHREPQVLVTSGIFRLSRNPIYLGDVLFLAGFLLWRGAAVPLMLVPVLAYVLRVRFILPEEERLARRFGPAWERWAERTRRWL